MIWKRRRVRIFSLIGKAGTGKSYRARAVAEANGIELIIDDGLLIRSGTVVGGRSAKKESNFITATKTSTFEDPDHRAEMSALLKAERFDSLLVLGTSEKMIRKILTRIGMGSVPIHKSIAIESLSTADEIALAKRHRTQNGTHVIPVLPIEVRTRPAFKLMDSLRTILHRNQVVHQPNRIEQTIVYPSYGQSGVLAISDQVITQMLGHCLLDYSPDIQPRKSSIRRVSGGYVIHLGLSFPAGIPVPENLAKLQRYLHGRMERYTGVTGLEIHLTLEQIRFGSPAKAPVPARAPSGRYGRRGGNLIGWLGSTLSARAPHR